MSKATVKHEDLFDCSPETDNQQKAFDAWDDGDNLVLAGSAGTGKTFIALYLAMESVLERATPYNKCIIVRSVVPTRDMGYLPGTVEEKKEVFETPYKAIAYELFDDQAAYNKLINSHILEFTTTSFIRGLTIDNSIICLLYTSPSPRD